MATLFIILKFLSIIVPLLISVAYFTLAERKIMGSIEHRFGPNVVMFLPFSMHILEIYLRIIIVSNLFYEGIFSFAPLSIFLFNIVARAIVCFDSNVSFNIASIVMLILESL